MEESEARMLAVDEYSKWVLVKETMWRQKSKEILLKMRIKILNYSIKWPMHGKEEIFLLELRVNGE